MTEFNIQGSKIEQLNDKGNNYKFAGKAENLAVSGSDAVVQTAGAGNTVKVEHPKASFWANLWKRISACWKWLFG